MEREIFIYALGFASPRTAYVHKTVQVLYLLENKRDVIDTFVDKTALIWMDEFDVHRTSKTERCREACQEKWNMLHKLQNVQLKVPQNLKGGLKCAKCNCNNLQIIQRQIRSADEGMTSFITCLNCGYQDKIN